MCPLPFSRHPKYPDREWCHPALCNNERLTEPHWARAQLPVMTFHSIFVSSQQKLSIFLRQQWTHIYQHDKNHCGTKEKNEVCFEFLVWSIPLPVIAEEGGAFPVTKWSRCCGFTFVKLSIFVCTQWSYLTMASPICLHCRTMMDSEARNDHIWLRDLGESM